MRGPWLAVLEAFLVKKLLESPSFHRAIGRAHKSVHRLRHGTPPEELGGVKIDRPEEGFLQHFVKEVKSQAFPAQSQQVRQQGMPRRTGGTQSRADGRTEGMRGGMSEEEGQNKGFLANFWNEIREQARGGSKP